MPHAPGSQLTHPDRRLIEQAAGLLLSLANFTRHGEEIPNLLIGEARRTVEGLHRLTEQAGAAPQDS